MWNWLKDFLNGYSDPLTVEPGDVVERIKLDADETEAEFYRLTSYRDYKQRASGITRERHLKERLSELRSLADRVESSSRPTDVEFLASAAETRNAILEEKRPILVLPDSDYSGRVKYD